MTLSPELLAIIKDVKPASDEEIELSRFHNQFELRLIARVEAERNVVAPERETSTLLAHVASIAEAITRKAKSVIRMKEVPNAKHHRSHRPLHYFDCDHIDNRALEHAP